MLHEKHHVAWTACETTSVSVTYYVHTLPINKGFWMSHTTQYMDKPATYDQPIEKHRYTGFPITSLLLFCFVEEVILVPGCEQFDHWLKQLCDFVFPHVLQELRHLLLH